ncbi:hypothetical protein G6F68_012205 [Rhizopus microsporus]|nr:hypothetical protein G6F68_012205 [Rhizopus microsporus]
MQRALQHRRQLRRVREIDHVRLGHAVAEGHHRLVLDDELRNDRRGVRHQHVGGALRGHHLFRLDEAGIGTGQRAVALEQFRRALRVQRQQPVTVAGGDVGGDLRVQVRGRAQALGEGRTEQDHRATSGRRAQRGTLAAIIAEQWVQLRPTGLGHREVALLGGDLPERGRGGRALRAGQVEHAAHPAVAAGAVALLHVEAMEQLHLGPGQEGRHPVGGAEHRARAHRQGLLQADVGDPGQAAAGRAALEPGGHVLPGRVQGLRQRGENRQRIALRRKQQVPGHHVRQRGRASGRDSV